MTEFIFDIGPNLAPVIILVGLFWFLYKFLHDYEKHMTRTTK